MNSLTGIPRSSCTFLKACSDNIGFCWAAAAGPVWARTIVAPSRQIVSSPADHRHTRTTLMEPPIDAH
jgi:hypothetical protein